MIAASVLDTDWMDLVEASGGPWIFVAEAVLIYLDPADARRAVVALAKRFAGARIAFDWFRRRGDESREIESWGDSLRLAASKTFLDADRDLLDRLPLPHRLTVRLAPFLVRRQASLYRLNLGVAARE